MLGIKWIHNLFTMERVAKDLHIEIGQQGMRIKALMLEQKTLSKWNQQYISTLSLMTDTMSAMLWKKDQKHRYLLANPLHCKNFYGFPGTPECFEYILGKTDKDLIQTVFTDQGVENTFGKGCFLTDDHCQLSKKTIHYLEAGVVDNEQLLLYVVKTPQYTDTGQFIGTIGMAWNVTANSDFLVKQLNRWIHDEKAECIFKENNIFSYAIDPNVKTCDVFKHLCPMEKDKTCIEDCLKDEYCPLQKAGDK